MSENNLYTFEFEWDTYDNGVDITKYKGKDSSVVIPEKIDGKPVVSIGYGAFRGCSGLRRITLPDSLMKIKGEAFAECALLTDITIPDN